jgi:hypothetical protein
MATLILGLFRTRHNGLFIPGKETPVTVAKTYSTDSSMPTTRIQPAVTVPLAIAPNRKEPPAANRVESIQWSAVSTSRIDEQAFIAYCRGAIPNTT